MKKFKKTFTILFASVFIMASLLGCSSAKSDSSATGGYEGAVTTSAGTVVRETGQNSSGSSNDSIQESENLGEKMIYRARIIIETLEFANTLKDIEDYVSMLGGFVESSSISGLGEQYESSSSARGYAEIVFRVPATQYGGMMENIRQYGNVTSQSSWSENITSSYYDLDGRLRAYRTSEERLLEILKKANEVKDILEVERELANVRANIESITTQLKVWDSLVNYSTVTIVLREVKRISAQEPDTFGERLIQTIEKSFLAFMDFIKGIIIVVIYIIPYAVILAAIFILIYKVKGQGFLKRKDKSKDQHDDKTDV